MEKIFLGITVLLLAFTLSSCTSDDSNDNNPLDDIMSNNPTLVYRDDNEEPLKVGMTLQYPPFETIDINGNPIGISVEMAYELGMFLEREIEIVNLPWNSLITAVNTGEIDLILGSMSITAERENSVDFSNPYFYFRMITLLNKDFAEENDIVTLDDLWSTSGTIYVAPQAFFTVGLIEENAPGEQVKEVTNGSAAVLEVTTGASDAFIMSAYFVGESQRKNNATTVILFDSVTISPIGMAVAEGNTELLALLNDFINGLDTNGVYDRLADKYDSVIGYALEGKGIEFYTNDNEE